MDTYMQGIARQCLEAARANSMTFPQIVSTLTSVGFEGYLVDFRRGTVAYYLPSGETVEFSGARPAVPVAAGFNTTTVKEAIHEAQTLAPGYNYQAFLTKVAGAGCAGYMVSFLDRRVLYFARSAEIHVEHFPQ